MMRIVDSKITQLRTFIILRLFIATFLLFLAQVVFRLDSLVFYYLIAVVCVLSLIYLVWIVSEKHLLFLSWMQIIFDLILETFLIQFTGVIDSLFAPIYVLSIISAGIMIAPQTSFFVASLASILFIGLVTLNNLYTVPGFFLGSQLLQVDRDPLYLFYATYVRVTIFFVVAVLTNHLTGTIQKLEEKVKFQERLAFLGDVTSRIAHEIRNPLAAISSSVEVLSIELGSQLTDKNKKLMTAVVEESERLKRIFSKILVYARNDELKRKPIDMVQLLDKVLLIFENSPQLAGQAVKIIKKFENNKIVIDADEEQMTDMLSNVFRNAYEAMPQGGVLTVSLNRVQDSLEIDVSDTGEGMSKETLKGLFLPFKTTKKTGTGIGLAQAHKIVTIHGGKINVTSEPKMGTHIQIILPIHS